jgi:hypothetical protein
MSRQSRSNLAIGLILVLLGAWFLATQLIPGLKDLINISYSWPLTVVGMGVFLFLLGLILRVPNLAIPACIIGGIGVLLYWQNATNRWESWAYAWTLIPGFVGVGIILTGFLDGEFRSALRSGLRLILISLIMFVLFWIFLGGSGLGWEYWPILLVVFGIWTLIDTLLRRR